MTTTDELKQMIESECGMDHLSKILENVMYKYTIYILEDNDRHGSCLEESNELFYLKFTKEMLEQL